MTQFQLTKNAPPKAGAATDDPIVLDNLPEVIPVTGRELEIIETFLGNLIDGLLLDAASDRAMTPLSVPNPAKPIRASRQASARSASRSIRRL